MTSQERANLENLIAFWTRLGTRRCEELGIAQAHASQSWPHRYWLDPDTDLSAIGELDDLIALVPPGGVVPVWFQGEGPFDLLEEKLLAAGFEVGIEQTAMCRELEPDDFAGEESPALAIETLREGPALACWCEISGSAFGYDIDPAVIERVAGDSGVWIYLAYREGRPAGTALTLQLGEVVGIYQVGVASELRGQGIARTLMGHVLGQCRRAGARLVTLQASAAGAGVYRPLGFAEQFRIRNYRRPL